MKRVQFEQHPLQKEEGKDFNNEVRVTHSLRTTHTDKRTENPQASECRQVLRVLRAQEPPVHSHGLR